MASHETDIDRLLRDAAEGKSGAQDALWDRVYDALKHLADRMLRTSPGPTQWEPEALVNET